MFMSPPTLFFGETRTSPLAYERKPRPNHGLNVEPRCVNVSIDQIVNVNPVKTNMEEIKYYRVRV